MKTKPSKKVLIPIITVASVFLIAVIVFCVYWFGIRCEHELDKGQITTPATCATEGVLTKSCLHCDYQITESIPATGEHKLTEATTDEPTCSTVGTLTRSCNACDYTETEDIPTLPHTYELKVTKKSTCKEKGLKEEVCTVCSAKGKSEELKLADHKYKETVTKAATCTATGEKTKKCTVCDKTEKETIPVTTHNWSSWNVTKEATFESTGKRTHTCSTCGKTESETIPVKVLTYSEKKQMALQVAKQIAASIGPGEDIDRISKAAEIVADYSSRCVYTSEGSDYCEAYGVFIKGEYTCAGSTRALGMVLECMGYSWEHINENQWDHQWCKLVINGKEIWADGQAGLAGYGKYFGK